MVRPRILRTVGFQPDVTYFKPAGVPVSQLEISTLTVDETEALRLADLESLNQEESAKKMSISQPTFNRLVESARKKVADALINGKAIRIEGGNYKMAERPMGGRFRAPQQGGRGRMGGDARGPGGYCICSKCGYKIKQERGVPCYTKSCPKCESPMTRE